MRISKLNFSLIAVLILAIFLMTACPGKGGSENPGSTDPNETAATVNGTAIKMEDVEREIKKQSQGQEARLSQLELTQARLQVLDQLIQQEVMYQKAQSESTMPTDEEVTAEVNNIKTNSGVSKEEFDKRLSQAGETEDTFRESVKKQLAIKKLVEKVTGKVDAPKETEIEAFYNGNKDAFVKKRGVRLAAIVVDPANSGQGDTTTDETSANLKIEEIRKKLGEGVDFGTLAASESEDPSKMKKGDLGYITEDQLKQTFSPQIASMFMDPKFEVGQYTSPVPLQGKAWFFKLQERNEKEEKLTLDSPGVRQQITDNLVNARKQLVSAAYAAIAMDEAKIVNYLAQKVVDNPNDLSGARPALPANEATEPDSNSNSNADTNSNANAEVKPEEGEKKAEASNKEEKPKEPSKETPKETNSNTAENK
ncbi:MAG: SurA N-terminal domain-containing protein [Pyrinomonadaceae bacterium]